jgi:ribosomal protein S18 acetylase RimI-like enzyme
MPVIAATPADINAIVSLVNSAYRGESSKQGWTTEANLLKGELRIDAPALSVLLQQPGALVLKYVGEDGSLCGSVYLQKQERGLYLGMLTVSPLLQAGGIGRQLMAAAEAHARSENCSCIFMNVISLRKELIDWYERLGYYKTGETKPMATDHRFGVPVQPLEFVIMEKKMFGDSK